MAEAKIRGLDNLFRDLKALPDNLEKNVLRSAMLAAARELAELIRARAPVGGSGNPKGRMYANFPPGSLRSSIQARARRGKKGEVSAGVGGAFYGKFVEKGHTMVTHKPGKRVVGHVPAYPFILPTAEASKERIVKAIQEAVAKGIDRALNKRIKSFVG